MEQEISGGFIPSDCPLVEIPTPHGRLIDSSNFSACMNYGELIWEVDHASTILEAEDKLL